MARTVSQMSHYDLALCQTSAQFKILYIPAWFYIFNVGTG